ncbi:MAG TPA: hypothetical protein VFI31_30710 [Pirellulales bacterium]|nr:hypothetical protein [Pirellulales bacterium]
MDTDARSFRKDVLTFAVLLSCIFCFAHRVTAFENQRERLDRWRKTAAALIQVAVFDECLLLSGNQRNQLFEALIRPTSEAWWRPSGTPPMLDTTSHRLLESISARSLGVFVIPDVELTSLLERAPWVVFKELRDPIVEEVVVEGRAADLLPGRAVAGAPQRIHMRLVRRSPPLDEVERRLRRYLDRRLEKIDAVCHLTPPVRQKLALAGAIDIARYRERWIALPRNGAAEGPLTAEKRAQLRGRTAPLPLLVFNEAESYFHKMLFSRMLEGVNERLIVIERERREFQRGAVIAAVVARLQPAASMPVEECEALANLLSKDLSEFDACKSLHYQLDWLRRIADVPCIRTCGQFADQPLHPLIIFLRPGNVPRFAGRLIQRGARNLLIAARTSIAMARFSPKTEVLDARWQKENPYLPLATLGYSLLFAQQ